MTRSRVALLLVVVASAAAAILWRRSSDGPAATEPTPLEEPVWAVSPPADAPTGAPFVLGRAPRPEVVRWSGTFSYGQAPSGRFGPEAPKARRALAGTFTALEATTGPASARETVVKADFALEDAAPPAAPATRRFEARLSFVRDARGAVVHRSIRLDAPAEVLTQLELFQAAFAQRFGPPPQAVRTGARIPIDDAIDVDDLLKRPLLFLFKERAPIDGWVNAPAEGGVWVVGRTGEGGAGRATLAVALTHAHAGENGPKGANAVRVDYRAKLEGRRTFDLADGRVTAHELSIARRIGYASHDFDYAVLVRSRIEMAEDGPAK